jgi:hypothetical protein
MYDDHHLKPRLTGPIVVTWQHYGMHARMPINGNVVVMRLPEGLLPSPEVRRIQPDSALARVVLGYALSQDRTVTLGRPLLEVDLW